LEVAEAVLLFHLLPFQRPGEIQPFQPLLLMAAAGVAVPPL
jgi:hypothetical protein